MAKSNQSVRIDDVDNSRGEAPEAEARGVRLTVKPTRFMASVKADGTFKTVSLHNLRMTIDTAEMSASTGFPVGSVIAVNAYLPVKRAKTEQLQRAVRNWKLAKAQKAEGGSGSVSVDDVDDED